MNKKRLNGLKEWFSLILVLFMVMAFAAYTVGLIFSTTTNANTNHVVGISDCFEGDDGWKFCLSLWVRNISIIDVYQNGTLVATHIAPRLAVYEHGNYKIQSFGNFFTVNEISK